MIGLLPTENRTMDDLQCVNAAIRMIKEMINQLRELAGQFYRLPGAQLSSLINEMVANYERNNSQRELADHDEY